MSTHTVNMSGELTEKAVYQAHAISRGSYSMPPVVRRAIALVMSKIPQDSTKIPDITLSVGEIARELDLDDGEKTYEQIRKLQDQMLKQIILIPYDNGDEIRHQWVSRCHYKKSADTITFRIHSDLKKFVLDPGSYQRLLVEAFSKLKGRYSQRWYELLMSRQSQADKTGYWFFPWITVEETRHTLGLGPLDYPQTRDFRKRCVTLPIQEINENDLGFKVKVEDRKKGRSLDAFMFHCYPAGPKDPKPADTGSDEQTEAEKWAESNPELLDKYINQIKQEPSLPGLEQGEWLIRMNAIHMVQMDPEAINPKTGKKRGKK